MDSGKTIILQGKTAPERLADLKSRVRRLSAQRPKKWPKKSPKKSPSENRPVDIIAVSKGQSVEKILPLLHAGHRVFGENRVQEALEKWPALKRQFPDIVLHLIGPLQTNKIDAALSVFDVIATLDRKKLADGFFQRAKAGSSIPPLFIQINTGSESQKSGILPEAADAFISYCRDDIHLPIEGLMCLPPFGENPSPHFALLSEMAHHHHLASLSMGMSADFEAAILLGATHIRPGQIVFGARS